MMQSEDFRRADGRDVQSIRRVEFEPGFTTTPAGSVLTRFGRTVVLCTCTVVDGIPRFRPEESGWMTAEYAMAPGSTMDRVSRERRGPKGRTSEIERLIGRSLRAGVDLSAFGNHTVHIDCEVLQADGGTRTASITGAFVALAVAAGKMLEDGRITRSPFKGIVSAVSCGIVDGRAVVDLPYEEDVRAEVDLNLVMLNADQIIEVQGTGEEGTMSRLELNQMLDLGQVALASLQDQQIQAIGRGVARRLGLVAE